MEKLKIFKVNAFVADSVKRPDLTRGIGTTGAVELFLPIEAISHLTKDELHSPRGSYSIHIKKNYPLDLPFLIKSFSTPKLTPEQVELIAQ